MFHRTAPPRRPGRVARLLGVILQNDGASRVGGWFIRPVETLDRRLVGADRPARKGYPGLAMHAGLHVVMEDGREMVAEQLMGTVRNNFSDGLNWTPIEDFRKRDRGGWDATIPATAFRGIDEAEVARIVDRLNTIEGRAFILEDCAGFIERLFERRLFADSAVLNMLGISAGIGDPALPLLRRDVQLDRRTADLVRSDVAGQLPDPRSDDDSSNVRRRAQLALLALVVGVGGAMVTRRRQHGPAWKLPHLAWA